MPRPLPIVAIGVFWLSASTCSACTIFYAYDGKLALGGNNEDWKDPATFMWFKPGGAGEYGSVVFGFGNGWPQGGMNDQGLFFDAAATGKLKQKKNKDKPHCPHDIFDKMLRECATVGEAVTLLDRYSMPFMDRAILLIGDRHGNSVIYEGDKVLRMSGRHQVLTNYYQSRKTAEQAKCWRKQKAEKIFSERFGQDEPATVELMKSVLDAVHQEGMYGTKYSNVYDLTHGDVYLYCNHDFDVVVKFNLKQELTKGERREAIPPLFVAGKPLDRTRTAAGQPKKSKVAEEGQGE